MNPPLKLFILNPILKLFFYPTITISNNPSLKIYYINIIRMLWIRFLVETNPSIDIYIYIYCAKVGV